MLRYAGEQLGSAPHIVVFGSCKVGNLILSIPTLEGLRKRFPDAVIGFVGSDVTADLERALPTLNWRLSWDDPHPDAMVALAQAFASHRAAHGPVQLAINLDGFNPVTQVLCSLISPVYVAGASLTANRRSRLALGDHPQQRFLQDPDWNSPEFVTRYPSTFRSNYIAELFAALAWVSEYCDPSTIQLPNQQPAFTVPDVLIHCTTARSAKVWPFAHWHQVVCELQRLNHTVGLVGSPPKQQHQAYNSGGEEEELLAATQLIDLRGQTSLLELAGACAAAKAVISVDAGPLHIAAAVGTPTLAIVGNDAAGVGASPLHLWLPRSSNCSRTVSSSTCTLCRDARFGNDSCLADQHQCMLSVEPSQVVAWIHDTLR